MRRALLLLSAVLLLGTNAGAATPTEAAPGWIGADHPLYEVDVMLDNVLKQPGEVAHERASEAFVAAAENNSAAMDRALGELEAVANRTNGVEHADGLRKAEAVLLDLRDRVPEQAMFGIDTAIESVTKAKNRYPTDELPNDTAPESPAQRP